MNGNKKNDNSTKEDGKKCVLKTGPPVRNISHPLRYYEFTEEEIKALEECDKESFYQRCLPCSTGLATITYAAIRRGYLSRNPNFGVFPKILFAVLLGHICGRISYQPECDLKFRNLPPNSYLGEVMRKHCAENKQL